MITEITDSFSMGNLSKFPFQKWYIFNVITVLFINVKFLQFYIPKISIISNKFLKFYAHLFYFPFQEFHAFTQIRVIFN